MLTLTALVRNVFPTKEFRNKETGEITPPGHKVQLEYESLIGEQGDKKIELEDFNVRQNGDLWRKATGKLISVPVGTMVNNAGNVQLYIPRGALPTLAAVQQPKAA